MRKFRIPYIPYRSLLLSTTVLNDICNLYIVKLIHDDCTLVHTSLTSGKHLVQALPSVYTLTGKVDNNNKPHSPKDVAHFQYWNQLESSNVIDNCQCTIGLLDPSGTCMEYNVCLWNIYI